MNEDEWHEPMRFEISVIEVKSDCRVNHVVGEKFDAEYRTPRDGMCGEAYVGMYPLLYAMRVDGDMRQLGKKEKFESNYYCPSHVVQFLIRGFPKCSNCGKDVKYFSDFTPMMIKYEKHVCKERMSSV